MDIGDIGGNLPIIIAIVVLIFFQFFLRRGRKPQGTQSEIVRGLLSEVRLNLAIADITQLHWRTRRFEVTSWQRSKTKLDFLEQPLQSALSDAYTMAEDFNQQIAAAKKYKSTSYMVSVDVEKLKGPLTRSKEGLEAWLPDNARTKEPPTKYPSVLDDFFGGRR